MTEKITYLDNAATEKPYEAAIEAMVNAARCYGNPSSAHTAGRAAAELLEDSRKTLSSVVGCEKDEFYFTPSGTFANNAAILGTAYRHIRRTKRIISTDSEHPSVELPLKRLESEGFEVIRVTTKDGLPDYEALENALMSPTSLVTVMHVNNETGAVYDIAKVRSILDSTPSGAMLHCDNIQGFLKESNPLRYCDMMSVSAHKIGGVKGCGGLYLSKTTRISTIVEGGGQERSLNPGTEAMPAIAAFAAAVKERTADSGRDERISELKSYLLSAVTKIDGIEPNLPKNSSPYIISLSLLGVKSEVATNYLSSIGICVSAGSACSSKNRENRVLTAYGLERTRADGTIRVSLSPSSTKDDIDKLCAGLRKITERIIIK